MFATTTLRGISFRPARFCAPLAGFTHSAFRRVVERLATLEPDGLDLNLACHAPSIRHLDAGSRLFQDAEAMARALGVLRACWPGLLLVKIRLGPERPDWRESLRRRLRIFEDAGVDAITLHPRFFEDKFKRRTRHEEIAWAAGETRLPLIANGDLNGPASVAAAAAHLAPAAALMIGRMAVVQPWLFAQWDRPRDVDMAALWKRMADEVEADFPPIPALGRLKLFTTYFARNFLFGHSFATAVQNAPDMAQARARAGAFLDTAPARLPEPSLQGL